MPKWQPVDEMATYQAESPTVELLDIESDVFRTARVALHLQSKYHSLVFVGSYGNLLFLRLITQGPSEY